MRARRSCSRRESSRQPRTRGRDLRSRRPALGSSGRPRSSRGRRTGFRCSGTSADRSSDTWKVTFRLGRQPRERSGLPRKPSGDPRGSTYPWRFCSQLASNPPHLTKPFRGRSGLPTPDLERQRKHGDDGDRDEHLNGVANLTRWRQSPTGDPETPGSALRRSNAEPRSLAGHFPSAPNRASGLPAERKESRATATNPSSSGVRHEASW